MGLMVGGCSLSIPIASFIGEPEATGSITDGPSPLSPDLGPEDWRRAKGALAIALDPQGAGSTVSWDNPDTALKGNFTPVALPFVKGDEICRVFVATLVTKARTASLQGTACRSSGSEWAITDIKPWKKAP